MFDTLSEKLQATLSDLRSHGTLTEDDIDRAMREIRLALLEADVNFKVVKSFTAAVKERCLGADVIGGLNPGQLVVKIVDEELAELMGGASVGVTFAPRPPTVILLAGLQGSGKTTAAGKLARFLARGARLVGRDGRLRRLPAGRGRSAAHARRAPRRRRLRARAPTRIPSRSPPGRSTRPSAHGKDVLIVDTAGRLHVDAELMDELVRIRKAVKPTQILLVVDAMTGQDAVNVAQQFAEAVAVRRRDHVQARRRRARRRRAVGQGRHRQADPVREHRREARPVRALPPGPHGAAHPRDGRRPEPDREDAERLRRGRGQGARAQAAAQRVHARGLPRAAPADPQDGPADVAARDAARASRASS